MGFVAYHLIQFTGEALRGEHNASFLCREEPATRRTVREAAADREWGVMRAMRILVLTMILCAGGSALAQDGVTVRVLNDTPDSLTVTLYDRNVQPPQPVVSSAVINGNASISVSITADASGRGHLSWNAITTDTDMRRCGHGEKSRVNDGDTIHVHANRRCSNQ
jgi:hypothetical protein